MKTGGSKLGRLRAAGRTVAGAPKRRPVAYVVLDDQKTLVSPAKLLPTWAEVEQALQREAPK